jgi:hypothetical protein
MQYEHQVRTQRCFLTALQATFWYIMGTLDILFDTALVILPTMVVWDLQMNWQKKAIVASAFAFRALCVPFLKPTSLTTANVPPESSQPKSSDWCFWETYRPHQTYPTTPWHISLPLNAT